MTDIEELRRELQEQIAELSGEVRSMRKSLSRSSRSHYRDMRDGTSEMFEEMWSRVLDSIPDLKSMRRHARSANRTVHDHPAAAAAVVGLAVLGLLASLMMRR